MAKTKNKSKRPHSSVKSIKQLIKERKPIQPLERHKRVLENIGKGKTLGQAIEEAGYSKNYADNPQLLRKTKSWQQLMDMHLPDEKLARIHDELLGSSRLDHITFPVYSEGKSNRKKKSGEDRELESLTDKDIECLLKDVGCVVKRIVHSDHVRYVYFWSPDNMTRDKALDKAYKLKGKYEPETLNLKFNSFSKEQLADMLVSKLSKK